MQKGATQCNYSPRKSSSSFSTSGLELTDRLASQSMHAMRLVRRLILTTPEVVRQLTKETVFGKSRLFPKPRNTFALFGTRVHIWRNQLDFVPIRSNTPLSGVADILVRGEEACASIPSSGWNRSVHRIGIVLSKSIIITNFDTCSQNAFFNYNCLFQLQPGDFSASLAMQYIYADLSTTSPRPSIQIFGLLVLSEYIAVAPRYRC